MRPDCGVCSVPQGPSASYDNSVSSPPDAGANADSGSPCASFRKRTKSESCSGLFHVIVMESDALAAAQPLDSEPTGNEVFDGIPASFTEELNVPSAPWFCERSTQSYQQIEIEEPLQKCEPHCSLNHPHVQLPCLRQNSGGVHSDCAADRTPGLPKPASSEMSTLMTNFLLTFVVNDFHHPDLHSQ